MSNYFKGLLGLLIIVFTLETCIEPFDFEAETTDQLLVVDGQFVLGGKQQQLRLTRSSTFGTGPGTPITNAQIQLFDDLGQVESFEPIGSGFYQLNGNRLKGEVGRNYFIEIVLPDGEVYQSYPQTMPPLVKITDLSFHYDTIEVFNQSGVLIEQSVIEILVDTPIKVNGEPVRLRWETEEVYAFPEIPLNDFDRPDTCYITKETDPQNIKIISSLDNQAEKLEDFSVATKFFAAESPEFRGRHYFTVIQYALTQQSFEFWEQVQTIADREGSLFDAPPGVVNGNIFNVNDEKEIVLGNFTVASSDTIRRFLDPLDIFRNFFLIQFCVESDDQQVLNANPSVCFTCTELINSTLEKPDWWE